jgi:hypothetical protein
MPENELAVHPASSMDAAESIESARQYPPRYLSQAYCCPRPGGMQEMNPARAKKL